MGERETQTNKA